MNSDAAALITVWLDTLRAERDAAIARAEAAEKSAASFRDIIANKLSPQFVAAERVAEAALARRDVGTIETLCELDEARGVK